MNQRTTRPFLVMSALLIVAFPLAILSLPTMLYPNPSKPAATRATASGKTHGTVTVAPAAEQKCQAEGPADFSLGLAPGCGTTDAPAATANSDQPTVELTAQVFQTPLNATAAPTGSASQNQYLR